MVLTPLAESAKRDGLRHSLHCGETLGYLCGLSETALVHEVRPAGSPVFGELGGHTTTRLSHLL